uniref:Uncharacterized protein n=1 Tax=Romanomermis culicivorax TaxID=13658 RepID=A0A915IYQ1_ROMCU
MQISNGHPADRNKSVWQCSVIERRSEEEGNISSGAGDRDSALTPNTRFSMTNSIFAIFLAILSLMIMQSAGQRCEMLDSWKTMEGTVAFTAISWSSISDAVQTNDNGDYNLQKVFTKANNCWANRNYRLHFGKTECQPFEQAVVPAVGQGW